MKKLISFMILVILAFSLCSCTDSDDRLGSDLPGADKILDQQGEKEDAPVKDGVTGVELPDLDVSGKNESTQTEDNKTQTDKEENQSADTPVSSEKEENSKNETNDQNVESGNEGSSNSSSQDGSAGAEAPSGGIELPDFDF